MKSNSNQLFLHEEIFLLALKDEEGTLAAGAWYGSAIGGAVLAELVMAGRVKVIEEGKKKFARFVNKKPFGNEVLDECLDKIAQAKKQAELSTWIGRFAELKELKHRVAIDLCEKRILKADEKTVLWIFTRKIYPERDPKPEREIIERIRRAVFTNTRELDSRTVILTVLANATSVLPVVFDKKDLKKRKERIEQLASGELLGEAAKEAVEAMQAAIFVAVILPAIITPVIINH